MKIPEPVTPLLQPLAAVQRLLARFEERGLIIGGVAVSVMGKPRLTADVDAILIISIEELPHLVDAARAEGLLPRLADAIDFARQHRMLLLRHEMSGVDVDISLGMLPFEEEAVARGSVHDLGAVSIRLPTVEDLVIFKAVAHRPKDLMDIQALIEIHPTLDRKRIKRWVREFAQALEMPEIWDDIAKWLK
jgi:hypothetical protein